MATTGFNFEQPAYVELRNTFSQKTSPLLAWIGSGLSQRAGLPSWSELRGKLQDSAEQKALSFTDDKERAPKMAGVKEIKAEADQWRAFEMLKRNLGETTFRSEIRRYLGNVSNLPTPLPYKRLWRLPFKGVLSLNLDPFALRAFNESGSGKDINHFSATHTDVYSQVLKSSTNFIGFLHGTLEDYASWVLTKSDLRRLTSSEVYRLFINSCLTTHTVVFIGITVDDVAVGGYLEDLLRMGYETGPHFWITHRQGATLDSWAEKMGVQIIRYSPRSKEHPEIEEMLQDLQRYIPQEEAQPPLRPLQVPIGGDLESVPLPSELMKQDHETIRMILNQCADKILAEGGKDAYFKYSQFCKTYAPCVHAAWFVTSDPPYNKLLGYTLIEELGSGAFSTVYRAQSDMGNDVALKLIKSDVHSNPEMLQSFRRGVRSMRILSDHKVQGMVPYAAAAELPTFVTMELIDGPDLKQVIERREIKEWVDILQLCRDITEIVHRAHRLPERVLHRDIRPQNIMLRGFGQRTDWDVVLLDFDLSWHRDATEDSIVNYDTFSGFIAPELIERPKYVTTRSALVDAFGLGMTFYYLRTCIEPRFGIHRAKSWDTDVVDQITKYECKKWKSAPTRFARLILETTRDGQNERKDVSEILKELVRLADALKTPEAVLSTELLAEEIICRAGFEGRYLWNPDKHCAEFVLANGLKIYMKGNEQSQLIELCILWNTKPNIERRDIGKYITSHVDEALGILKKIWANSEKTTSTHTMELSAEISTQMASTRLDELGKSISQVVHLFDL